jgi:hypothetical protein
MAILQDGFFQAQILDAVAPAAEQLVSVILHNALMDALMGAGPA